jgi:hypothetical protein
MKSTASKGSEKITTNCLQRTNRVFQFHVLTEELMARMSKNVTVTSPPVRTFPNGDFFYIELSRRNSDYDCVLRMARSGDREDTVLVARANGKTIRQAEQNCYQRALERCPRLPSPPYLKRMAR